MDHVCSSTKDIHNYYLPIDPNMESIHPIQNSEQVEVQLQDPFFFDFPSPFFDDISASNYQNKPLNITEPLRSVSKDLKRGSGGKKDRHSKIRTAQGVRDRRMRLPLQIARKFFDLQDLLGFDKASKTIEWLFCKSNKAIKEVTENFDPHQIDQSIKELVNLEVGLGQEMKRSGKKVNKSKDQEEMIKKRESRNSSLVKETRDQARARARDRTRKRLMVKEQLERSNQLFEGNPKDELLGFISSLSEPLQRESSSSSFEHSGTHLLVPQPFLATNNGNSFENYSVVNTSSLINHNPQEGNWMNSWNGILAGEWDADSFVTEYYNYGSVLTDEQNPSSFFMSTTTNVLHFQSPSQGK